MDFEIAIANALLYISVFLIHWSKTKTLDLFSTILLAYVMVAILGCVLISQGDYTYNLSIINFIYLFIAVLIFIWPFRYAKFTSKNITIIENRWINLLLIIYFITGIIILIYAIPRTIALSKMDDWATVRDEVYVDPDAIEYYGNTFEKLSLNIWTYLSPFGIVMATYQLTKKKFNAILSLSIFIVWGANAYCGSTVVASRGMIVFSALSLVLVFLIFRKSIPRNRKKYIYFISIVVAIFFASYVLAVSHARFKDDTGDSTLWYLGQSMNVFNQDIMTPIKGYANGKYFFKWFYELFGVNPDINFNALGTTHGVQFMTFIGCFYIDFGPIGTIIVGLIMCRLLMTFTRKKHYYLSDLIVIAYYANWYINGVLVVGRSQSLPWAMLFIVYFIVRTVETRKIPKRKISRKRGTIQKAYNNVNN